MTRQDLVELVGPLTDVIPGDDTVHDGCSWRVRGLKAHPLDNFTGQVIWLTTRSVGQATAGVPSYTPVTVHGHPGMFGQTRGTTLLLMSTGDDIDRNGELSIHLSTGRAGARRVALTLAAAGLAYTDAHSGTPS
ncbi:MAG TPA: hypothetical protein VFX70_16935 [Mycobacteriales bacterium]|nr:hypothetical protein [Mycobacteriales bacterium]